MSHKPVPVLLAHMLDAAREARAFVCGKSREDLDGERQLQHSLIRCIQVIGEAASRVDPVFRADHPEMPWIDMIGMRNRLVHAYFDIELDMVWRTSVEELPELIALLERLMKEQTDDLPSG